MRWLTREEWQVTFCISMALTMDGQMNTHAPIDQLMRGVIDTLENEYGYEFEALTMRDRRLYAKTDDPITPGAIHWINQLRLPDRAPDLETHFPEAIRIAEEDERLSGWLPLLRETWAMIQRKRDEHVERTRPTEETRKSLIEFLDQDRRRAGQTIH